MKPLALALLATLFLLTGCARFAYQPPQGAETATLIFSSDGISVQPMVCVPGKGFKATEYSVSRSDSDSETVTQLNEVLRKQPRVTTQVDSGPARVGFSFTESETSAGMRDRCKIAVVFNAQPGARYQANFSMPNGQCAMTLTSDTETAVDAVIVPWECR